MNVGNYLGFRIVYGAPASYLCNPAEYIFGLLKNKGIDSQMINQKQNDIIYGKKLYKTR